MVMPGEEYGLPAPPTPRTPPMEEIIPDKDDDDRDDDVPRPPTPPMEEIIPEKEPEEPPRPLTPPMEELIQPPPLLEVSELPEGERYESEPGMIEVILPEGGQLSFMETPTGYIQLGGETYETRWQPFIPTTPSKELRKELERYGRLEGREQFEQAIKIGIVPEGSEYIPPERRGESWRYITPEEAEVRRHLEEWEKGLKGTSPELYKIYEEDGYEAYKKAAEAQRAEYEALIKELKSYAVSELQRQYPHGGAPFEEIEELSKTVAAYNLVAALQEGFSEVKLRKIFPDDVDQAIQTVAALELLEPYKTKEGLYDTSAALYGAKKDPKLKAALIALGFIAEIPPTPKWAEAPPRAERTWQNVHTGKVVTQTELKQLYPKGYEAGLDEWVLTRESAAQLMKDIGQTVKGIVMRIPEDVQLAATMRLRRLDDPNGLWDYYDPKTGETRVITTIQFNQLIADFESRSMEQRVLGGPPESHPFDRTTTHMTPEEKRALLEVGMVLISVPLAFVSAPAIPAASTALLRGLSLVPRFAANFALHAGVTIFRLHPAYYAAATVTEAAQKYDLERKWEIFQGLPEARKNEWTNLAGFKDSFDNLDDLQKAAVLTRYAMPASVTLADWQGGIGKVLVSAQNRVLELNALYVKNLPVPAAFAASALTWFGEAALVEMPAYVYALIPMVIAEVADQAPEGNAVPYALATAAAFALFFRSIPSDVAKDPTKLGYYLGLFTGPKVAARAIVNSLKAMRDAANLRNLPKTALALQPDVERIVRAKPEVKEVIKELLIPEKEARGMTFLEARTLMQNLEFTAMTGKTYTGIQALRMAGLEAAFMPHRTKIVDPTTGKVTLYKSALETVLAQTMWHGTPKTTDFKIDLKKGYMETGTPADPLTFFSPHMPQSFMIGTKGSPAVAPGGVAVRFGFGDISWDLPVRVQRILDRPAKNEIEAHEIMVEARQMMRELARTHQLEPGKIYGVFKEYGQRIKYTVEGDPVLVGKPSLELEIVVTTGTRLYPIDPAKYAPSTFKHEVIRYKKVVQPASELQITTSPSIKAIRGVLPGDKFDKAGGLVKPAEPYPHPEITGLVRRRVTAVVVDKGGRILLTTDRMEPRGYYGLAGGDMIAERLAPGSTEAGIRYSIEAYADMQLISETGIGFVEGSAKRLPAYLGQMNRHSLPGSYVVYGVADKTAINLWHYLRETYKVAEERAGRKLSKDEFAKFLEPDEIKELTRGPELRDAIWWNGKTTVEVSPATYDIIVKLVKEGILKDIDISKLRISEKTPPELLIARGTDYYKPESLDIGGVKEVVRYVPERVPTLTDYNTAVSETRSWISQPEMEGYGIRAGQKIPIVWLRTARAIDEGLGLPTVAQIVGVKAATPIMRAFTTVFLDTAKRRTARAEEPAATTAVGYRALQLKDFKRAVTDTFQELGEAPSKKLLRELDRAKTDTAVNEATRGALADLAKRVQRRIDARVAKGEPYRAAEFDEVMRLLDRIENERLRIRARQRFYEKYMEEYLPYRGREFRWEPAAAPEREVPWRERPFEEFLFTPRRPIIAPLEEPLIPAVSEPRLEPPPIERPPRVVPERAPEPIPRPEPVPYPPYPPYPPEPVPYPPYPPYPPAPPYPPKVPYVPYVPPPPPPPPPPPRPIPTPEVKEEKRIRIPPGSIAWRQGFVWRYIPPPWDQPKPLTLEAPPIGATILGRTPRETIQMIGRPKAKVPKEVSVDLGIVDILITRGGKHIEFTGGGLKTIVGERIMVPEKGMSIPATSPIGLGTSGLKFGSSFEEALTYVTEDEALKDFIEDRIREMISEMSTEEFTRRVKALNLSEERVAELLSYMPDRQRGIAEGLLATEKLYTRVGPGYQYAETTLTRPKKLTKKQLKSLEEDEKKELYTESELREMEAESLGRLKKRGKKDTQPSIVSLRGLEDL